ncbi:MAG: AraC family transcriptional regulator [Clostridia bacterium]|nr:AraC family transcriptional regulator [Clostridia bacterium]
MKTTMHRFNSANRQHYVFDKNYTFKLKPRLLYVGDLKQKPGWEEKPHCHDFCEIIFVVSGHGFVSINDMEYPLNQGDVVIYNPGVMHSERSSENHPFEFIFFAIDRFEITNLPKNHLLPENSDFVHSCIKSYDVLNFIFKQMILESDKKEYYYGEISKELARTALMYIIRTIYCDEVDSNKPFQNNEVLNIAIDFINDNISGDLSLKNIASKCFVSKFHLSHLFKQHKNCSIGSYILDIRLTKAKKLLEDSDLSISDICRETGFKDTSYFCRAFKKNVKITPLKYRKSCKEKNI